MLRSCKWLRSGSHMAFSSANTHTQSVSIWHTHTQKYTDTLSVSCSHTQTHTYCLHPLALLYCTDLLCIFVCLCVGVCVCVSVLLHVFVPLSKWSISERKRHCCFLHMHEKVCSNSSSQFFFNVLSPKGSLN